jgi:hypothetical protein
MDWWPKYRDHAGLEALLGAVPGGKIAAWRALSVPTEHVNFLEITRV